MTEPTHIVVRGAQEHNLRDLSVSLPRNRLVVFTGVSGSGKSSLAFDTIHQEGQRRFMESLSAYARQFLGRMERPRVESVEGVSPTVSIDQKTVNRNPRSTVGTVTELYDHLRLLMARLGTPACPECGSEVGRRSVGQLVESLLESAAGERLIVLAPIVRDRKGEHRKELEELARQGWARARVDGQICRTEEPPELARYEKHTIEVVVDRVRALPAERGRLTEALETAVRLAGGVVTLLHGEAEDERSYAVERACAKHPELSFPEMEPRLFSFNAPQGACPTCTGLGAIEGFDWDRLIDLDASSSACFRGFNDEGRLPFAHFDEAELGRVIGRLGGDPKKPLRAWPPERAAALIDGDPSVILKQTIVSADGRAEQRERPWRGLRPLVEMVWKYTGYVGLARFRSSRPCETCAGTRLNPFARAVHFRGRGVAELGRLSVRDARAFFDGLSLEGDEAKVGALLVREIRDRLVFLDEVGLGYLGLDRSAATLSGGEAQRIRLAAQVGSALQGVTYVLDEPSIGLHPRDNARLLQSLLRLRDRGNSVLVVEHDHETVEAADWVIDVGPGAGREGGQLVAAGPPAVIHASDGPTGRFLRGDDVVPVPEVRRPGNGATLRVRGARLNNLRGLDVDFALGTFTVVTGVSGSGKSTLIFQVLERALEAGVAAREDAVELVDGVGRVEGIGAVDKVIRISQQPIGRTPRSNTVTYTGAFDLIRDLFAQTPEARARGYAKGRFSFNVKGGRCEACEGAGVKTVEMQFLPDVEVPCESCEGRRFNAETCEIRWKGLSIADVLQLSCAEALGLFEKQRKLSRIFQTLVDVGLGYLPIGQPSTTLSGGEAQRIKLASELHRPATGKTVYLLDEPTTGLHFSDVCRLLAAIQRLVDAGNSVIVVEHHLDLIRAADRLVDLGPDGGDAGGLLVGEGTPEEVAALDTPTGRALAAWVPQGGRALAAAPAPTPYAAAGPRSLELRGARKHNLQGVDASIPHGKLTVITGPSGSGKTSLALDTVFAEGQRRYVESLSTYARRFLGRLERAPVDRVEGLAPAIAIDQHSSTHNPRSTVATVTEIHDVLRLLYARVGAPHCPTCDRALLALDPSMAARKLAEEPGPGWLLARLRPSAQPEERRAALLAEGWTRIWYGEAELRLDEPGAIDALAAGAELVIDRFDPSRERASRVSEAVQRAYALADGAARFLPRGGGEPTSLSERPWCPEHGPVLPKDLTPRHFSFNSRLGACVTCDGLGVTRRLVRERLFPKPEAGFWDALDGRVGAVLARSARHAAVVEALFRLLGVSLDAPVARWTPTVWRAVMSGVDAPFAIRWTQEWGRTKRVIEESRAWEGLEAVLASWNSPLGWLTAEGPCEACGGGRLQPALLAVRVGGRSIHQLCTLPVQDALAEVEALRFEGGAALVAERPLLELRRRLSFLVDVGLGYLALDRAADTLSGGEAQRIRLASQLGSGLTGVIYVLDEPTIGLHPRDTDRLMRTLEGLRDLGNTLLVVEHDPETMRRADHLLDLGPGAGVEGGRLLAAGTPAQVAANPASVTGPWLTGARRFPPRDVRRAARSVATLRRARGHNLREVDARLPLGVWVGVSGVSGSGKSTLIMDTFAPALRRAGGEEVEVGPHDAFELPERVDRVVLVDQSPIGRTPRSTPATYTGAMDALRKLFATTHVAKERGWTAGRFSFNAAEGRCELCEGRGATLVEMHFLPDVWVTCDACRGKRFNRETLEARWRGASIADVLAMRVDEVAELFRAHRELSRILQALVDVGLGYLSLGQPGTTLSGGEAQRVKLATELTSRRGHAVYILDEPTTGLHLQDVERLVTVLHRLVDAGHSVFTVEHHLELLAQCDWILDLGPEGGAGGGRVVAEGTPEQVMAAGTPTGIALRAALTRG